MKHSKSALFLMEMIIAILFFSLASAVCIQLFAKAHMLSQRTVNQNHAIIQAQNLAECYLALDGDLQQVAALFESGITDSSSRILVYFDENWAPCLSDEACFQAELVSLPLNENGLYTADIVVTENNAPTEALFSLTVSHHIPERRVFVE